VPRARPSLMSPRHTSTPSTAAAIIHSGHIAVRPLVSAEIEASAPTASPTAASAASSGLLPVSMRCASDRGAPSAGTNNHAAA
jgi:hypothetical protein